MPTVLDTAEGVISNSKESLANSFADSETFRDWTNAITYEIARGKVHFGSPPPPSSGETYSDAELADLRPWATIIDHTSGALVREGSETLDAGGTLEVQIEATVSDEDDESPSALYRTVENKIGKIAKEMFDLVWSRVGTHYDATRRYLRINRIDWSGPFREAPEDGAGDDKYVWYVLSITWGRETE